jgi:hypothetical protein
MGPLKSGYLDLSFDDDGVIDVVVAWVLIVASFDTTGDGSWIGGGSWDEGGRWQCLCWVIAEGGSGQWVGGVDGDGRVVIGTRVGLKWCWKS